MLGWDLSVESSTPSSCLRYLYLAGRLVCLSLVSISQRAWDFGNIEQLGWVVDRLSLEELVGVLNRAQTGVRLQCAGTHCTVKVQRPVSQPFNGHCNGLIGLWFNQWFKHSYLNSDICSCCYS